MNYYTSDLHLQHFNIIRLANRPFKTVEEMDEALIANWNNIVGPNDNVYHLGDFAFTKGVKLKEIFGRLNGRKHLIIGNHDGPETLALPWASVQHYLEINENGRKLVLFHYGMRSWNGLYREAIHLYGHSHNKLPGNSQSLDVGVDAWNYTPTTLPQILDRVATLPKIVYEDAN